MRFNISAILSITFLACGIDAELTSSQKKTLLSLHKEARAKLNASNMKSISWSDSLASAAQSYSEKCKGMVHSHTGPENLAGSSTGDVSRMFNNWMAEKSGFNSSGYRSKFKDISYNGEDIGHYSQIVWADNTEVGCGMTDCPNYSARYLLVCRYKTGNVIGEEVYALGSGGSSSSQDEEHDDDDHDHDSHDSHSKTTTKKTTTTHRSTTTTTHRSSTTTESQKSTTTAEEKETPNSTIAVDTMPTVSSNTTLNTNSTINNAPGTTVPINDPDTKDNNDNTNNKNTKDNQKEDKDEKKDKDNDENIIEEVGPSSYTTGTGTYVTGVAVTGSVVGAAAAFVFLKKNPKQYKQLTDNMKTISRSISRGATSVKRSATTVTRKITTRRANPPASSNSNSSESLYDGSTYRYEFTQNLNY